ncbi:hypothetical protein [Streptomyces sp. SM13]|uniref:hypothetical protein n=1 Tax=Streptomyces sp. SM13 TaxID=1983803 RepID=UPI0035BBBC8B
MLAFGARGVLYEAGLDVPEDVAPAGVDGSGEALHATCSLTSVAARQGGHRRVGRRLPRCPDRRRGPPAGRSPHRTAPAGGTEFHGRGATASARVAAAPFRDGRGGRPAPVYSKNFRLWPTSVVLPGTLARR